MDYFTEEINPNFYVYNHAAYLDILNDYYIKHYE